MKSASEMKEVRYQFRFSNVDYDADLEKIANLKLAQILADAPSDSSAVAVVEHSGRYYASMAEIKSRYRTFQEKAAGTTPHSAVRKALERLNDRIHRWRYSGAKEDSIRSVSSLNLSQI